MGGAERAVRLMGGCGKGVTAHGGYGKGGTAMGTAPPFLGHYAEGGQWGLHGGLTLDISLFTGLDFLFAGLDILLFAGLDMRTPPI